MSLFWQPVRLATGSDEEGMLVFADGPCFRAYQQGRVWLWFERTRRPARGSVCACSPESLALLRDLGAKFWNDTEWSLEVADERGCALFVLRFSAEERPALLDAAPHPRRTLSFVPQRCS